MDHTIRPAVQGDLESITAFTRDTFSWGDYVPERFEEWLADDATQVLVAANADDHPVALAVCTLLSPIEAWLQAARVEPASRRRGLASRLNQDLTTWAKSRGARVARLAIEDWNEGAISQTAALGYRPTCHWVYAKRAVGAASPVPEGNGGQRVATAEKVMQAPSGESGPAYLSWTSGPLAAPARNLFGRDWRWRRLEIDDLEHAGRNGMLFEARAGWAMAIPRADELQVAWMETSEEDAYALTRSLVDLAVDLGVDSIEFMIPKVDWLVGAVRRAGCDIEPLTVYSLPLA
ncbi:MAG: GNAT family N-acetyltransferase [Acidimicrobiia bacterium]|nr:GNAT family N-acetyltransferase [Acidimicrobiia bacterium]